MLQATNLRVNLQIDPHAIEEADPLFSWELSGEGNPSSFQFQINDKVDFLSPLVNAIREIQPGFKGLRPDSFQWLPFSPIYWRVRIKEESGGWGDWSEVRTLYSGRREKDFPGQWISASFFSSPIVPIFGKTFFCPESLQYANLWISAGGVAQAFLDTQEISEALFTPGWTDYAKRLYYRRVSLTSLMKPGKEQRLSLLLGEGWFKGIIGGGGRSQFWGGRTSIIAGLQIKTLNSEFWITTDSTWEYHHSHILESSMQKGENSDGNCNQLMDVSSLGKFAWRKVDVLPAKDRIPPTAHPCEPVRRLPHSLKCSVIPKDKRKWIINTSQNLCGRLKINLSSQAAGTLLRLRHGEMLLSDGELYTENLRGASSTDYHRVGSEDAYWETMFTFHGFQYAELSGWEGDLHPEEIEIVVLGSDLEKVGDIQTSNPVVNKLISNCYWTQISNFFEAPTDCPQRDERLGWTGDILAYFPSAAFLNHLPAFIHKWLLDLSDTAEANGSVRDIAPYPPGLFGNKMADAAWGDAATIVPWIHYQYYGDLTILETHFNMMEGWVRYCWNQSKEGLRLFDSQKVGCFGDWLSLKTATGKSLLQTAYLHRSLEVLCDACTVLGKVEKARDYQVLLGKCKLAFQNHFLKEDGKILSEGEQKEVTQTGQVIALTFGLIQESQRTSALKHLIVAIGDNDGKLSTGFVGLPHLLPVLSQNGHHQLACQIFLNKEWPGWLYEVLQGATTIWERWDGWNPETGPKGGMCSFNHYAYGSVIYWIYTYLGGIQSLAPGFSRLRICPRLCPDMPVFECSYRSIYGMIRSGWEQKENETIYTVEIPHGIEAEWELQTITGQTIRENLGPGRRQRSVGKSVE